MANENISQQRPPMKRRRFKWVLGLSLALNLLVIGAIAGVVVRGGPPSKAGHIERGGAKFAAPYIRALPREDQRKVQQGARETLPTRAQNRARQSAMYQEMLVILRAQDLDIEAARAVLEAQTSASVVFQEAAQQQWLEIIQTKSQAERLSYADAVEAEIQERTKRRAKRQHMRERRRERRQSD